MELSAASVRVSVPFPVLTTMLLADGSYFSSLPATACVAAAVALDAVPVLRLWTGAASAGIATHIARTPMPSDLKVRDMGTSSARTSPRAVPRRRGTTEQGN